MTNRYEPDLYEAPSVPDLDENEAPASLSLNTVDVTFLLDRSGSMGHGIATTLQAFNDYLDGLRQNPHILASLLQFDSGGYGTGRSYLTETYTRTPAASAPRLDSSNFSPRGSTPLYESIIEAIGRIDSLSSPFDRHVLVILTDGQADNEYEAPRARRLIAEKRAEGWQVLFLGADLDIGRMAKKLGIDAAQSLSYGRGTSSAVFRALAGSITKWSREGVDEEVDLSSIPQLGRR